MTSRAAVLLLALAAAPAAAAPAAPSFKLKPGAEGKLCLDCHPQFEDVLKKAFVHTPVKSRDCAGCHNPHASNHGKLLAAEGGAVCPKCHGTSSRRPRRARTSRSPRASARSATTRTPPRSS